MKVSPHFVIHMLNLGLFFGQAEGIKDRIMEGITNRMKKGWTDLKVEILF